MSKRYLTQIEIERDMERARKKADECDAQADQLESQGRRLLFTPLLEEDGKFKIQQAQKLRTTASNLRTTKMGHLKQKLAEFLTPPLPNVGFEDRSISAR